MELVEWPKGKKKKWDVVFRFNSSPTKRYIVDVSVRAILEKDHIQWPTESEITEAAIREPDLSRDTEFHWDDHSGETASPESYRGRALLRLCLARVVDPCLQRTRAVKLVAHDNEYEEPDQYTQTTFLPLPLTPGGGLGTEANDIFRLLYAALPRDNTTRIKLRIRNRFYSRCSIALVRRGSAYSALCRPV